MLAMVAISLLRTLASIIMPCSVNALMGTEECFMFSLSDDEVQEIFASGNDVDNRSRSQFATLNKGRGHNIKYRPYAFTEHGILMLASVLKSEIAALVSIRITNAFVAMRKALASIAPLLARIDATERRQIADMDKSNIPDIVAKI